MKEYRKSNYLDFLRIFATIAVVSIHVSATKWSQADVFGIEWKTYNIFDSISRWAVPAFLMISGALFLQRDAIPIKNIYSKYIGRLCCAYLFWSVFYYLFSGKSSVIDQVGALFKPGKTDKLISIINGKYHMWFIPMIIGIYMCLPIIKQIVSNKKVMDYFLIISFAFSFLFPQIVYLVRDFGNENLVKLVNAISNFKDALYLQIIVNFVFYFVLGYRLSILDLNRVKRVIIYLVGIGSFLFTVIITDVVSTNNGKAISTYYGNMTVNVLLEAVSLFVLFKYIGFDIKSDKINKFFVLLSKWSFGAYLVHIYVLEKMNHLHMLSFVEAPYVKVPFTILIVFVISIAISAICNCIPIVKKYIV